ncbi:N-acetylglucosamine-specific PTS transporter subunit IIBC [Salibacterium qingdaonense]|uniref:PTS system, N-acetylglucosamine-specific IIC component n=1 Tax=Salibacterium qingdaonense TaxID=266892 RepID=A0A1I4P080_9BACI|nr:N-acetylglucosamine-specific PTS transporter subunit IIBC [Salibacterium qingdaonense]SFM21158.1 PTS system, N-acetylglucosamine-specific IIC component [Salibacterium qingdaonense]
MLDFLQRIGKALMLPIATLPAAALLQRLGQDDLLDISFMAAAGSALFDNLPLLFAIGVAVGLSKDGNGAAGLAGVISFFVLQEGSAAINENIDPGFLGGIISGITAGLLYNRFHDIKLPNWLGFFGGRRFVPIITAAVTVLLAGIFGFIWPPVQGLIDAVGQWIINAGAVGVGVYGFLNRLLIPIGLHHVLNSLVWFEFGSYQGATGDLDRFFAGDPTAGIFMAGMFPMMMFGLPAACLAMILAAKPEKRAQVSGLLGGLALTSFLTGITEPIEFSFMFISPLLYVVHALLTAASMVVTYLAGTLHGFGFSAGAFDYVLNFNLATKPLLLAGIGIIFGIIYFVVFYGMIKGLNLKTPGREDDEEEAVVHEGDDKYNTMAQEYVAAIGGYDNIQSIDNCVTRLRLQMNDMDQVDEDRLKRNGAKGVMKVNNTNLQIIVGTDVEFVADAMRNNQTTGVTAGAGQSVLSSPLAGTVLPLAQVADEAFSSGALGKGTAVVPEEGRLYAPADGTISTVFPTHHAYGITTEGGYEVLLHIGLNTVELKGEHYTPYVEQGEQVKKGQLLAEFDIKQIQDAGYDITTPIIITNADNSLQVTGPVETSIKTGDNLLTLQ